MAAVDTPTTLDLRVDPLVIDLRTRRAPSRRSRRPVPLTYQPALDGLRGLAVAGVLLFHAGFSWAVGGYLGVSTFFTLSGYLITTLLLNERHATGHISLPAFWARRFRRLMPASLVTLAGIVVLFGPFVATGDQLAELPGDVVSALGYVANWRFILADTSYADLFTAPSPVQHFWSLAIEEQYYLFFPLLTAILLALGKGSRKLLFGVLAGLAVLSTVLMVSLHHPGLDTSRVYYGTDTRAIELLAGALLAVVLATRPDLLHRLHRHTVTAIGAVALALTFFWWSTVEQTTSGLFEGGLTVYALVTVAILVAALRPGPVQRTLAAEPLRQLGRISYGVYLIHWPVFLWLTTERTNLAAAPLFVLRVGVTIALAAVSFRIIEQPVRARQAFVGPRRWTAAPLAVSGVVVAVLLLGVTTSEDQNRGLGQILDAAPEAQDPADVLAALPDDVDTSTVPVIDRVLLVGDSVMGQAYEAFRGQFDAAGITTAYAGGPGTGPLQPQGDWAQQIDEWVDEFDPDVVVMEACCDYIRPTDHVYVDPNGDEVPPNSETVYVNWEREVLDLVDRAGAGGAHVLWVLSPPVRTNGFYGALEEHVTRLNSFYRTLPVQVVDWSAAVAPGGRFTWSLPGPEGDAELVRLEDGVHMTDYGNQLLADLTLATIQALGENPIF